MVTMTGLPSAALDVQLDLLRYYESSPGMDYAAAVTAAMFDKPDNLTALVSEPHIDENQFNFKIGEKVLSGNARHFGVLLHRRVVGAAPTYAVTTEIVDVLESACQSIPDYALHDSDLPSRSGFIYLERPITFSDRNNRTLVTRAIAWHVASFDVQNPEAMDVVRHEDAPTATEAGVILLLWTEPGDERDHLHESVMVDWRRMTAAHLMPPHGLWSMIGGVWAYGQVPSHADDHGVFRLLMTFFRFIEEAWVDPRAIEPERALRRRAARVNVVPEIKVIALRRRSQHNDVEQHGTVEWQHRWLVSGHWRNQYYPSIQQHRPKWISEYIKGPDDKPLVVHDKVFHVTR